MIKNKESVPKLRFPEFTDAWERKKLGDIIEEFNNRSSIENEFTVLSSTNTGMEIREGRVSGSSNIGYKIIADGDLVLSPQNLWLGNININNIGCGLVSPSYKTFKLKDVIPEFIKPQLRTPRMMDDYKNSSTQGASVVRRNLDMDLFYQITIKTPNKTEQKKIGDFFVRLDNLIAVHQRKLINLKDLKTGLLQNMFPKNGERFPRIRFPGFTDAWEQRRLGDYIVPFSEVTTENNQYPVLTSSRRGIFLQTDYYDGHQIASADNTGYNIVPRGFFTYRHMSDDEVFKFNINNLVDFGIVSTLYPVFTTSSDLDSKYLQYQLNEGIEFRKFSKLQKQGGSRTYMYLSKLKELELTMPKTVGEQKSISGFFTMIDNLITLHQRKLEHLQRQKSSLLQQMYV